MCVCGSNYPGQTHPPLYRNRAHRVGHAYWLEVGGGEVAKRTALYWAAEAIREEGEHGAPGGTQGKRQEETKRSGMTQVRVRYAQLRKVLRGGGTAMQLEEWTQMHGDWLHTARGGREGERWSAHTRHGFRRGAGAARRKETETVVVGPDDGIYAASPPGAWPWLIEYEAVIRSAASGMMLVRLRLQHGRDDRVEIGVSAWPADERGNPTRKSALERQQVNVPLDAETHQEAARELFWVFGWQGAPASRTGARGALEAAAEAVELGRDWEAVQRALSGALPRQSIAERVKEKKERVGKERRIGEAKKVADAAVEGARACRQRLRGDGRSTGESVGESEEASAGRAVREAAQVLQVEAGAAQTTIRKRYLKEALRAHPDKPGGEEDKFRRIQEAYEALGRHAPEERRRLVGATAAAEGRSAATADSAARCSATTPVTPKTTLYP